MSSNMYFILYGVSCGISFNLGQTNRENAIQTILSVVAFEVLSLSLSPASVGDK